MKCTEPSINEALKYSYSAAFARSLVMFNARTQSHNSWGRNNDINRSASIWSHRWFPSLPFKTALKIHFGGYFTCKIKSAHSEEKNVHLLFKMWTFFSLIVSQQSAGSVGPGGFFCFCSLVGPQARSWGHTFLLTMFLSKDNECTSPQWKMSSGLHIAVQTSITHYS